MPEPWLVLIHQLPPKPPYLRVKVWRRLQALGAVPLKNSVYVLPSTDDGREDFEWVLREIRKEGGEASLCEARLVEGLTDEEVRHLFLRARGNITLTDAGEALLPLARRILADADTARYEVQELVQLRSGTAVGLP